MKRILIIENNIDDFKSIRNALVRNGIVNRVEDVHPNCNVKTIKDEFAPFLKDSKEFYNDFSLFHRLFFKLKETETKYELFDIMFHVFGGSMIDLFIIDKELIEKTNDSYGIEFYEYLKKNNGIPEHKLFIITPQVWNNLSTDIDRKFYVQKDKEDIDKEYVYELIDKIKEYDK